MQAVFGVISSLPRLQRFYFYTGGMRVFDLWNGGHYSASKSLALSLPANETKSIGLSLQTLRKSLSALKQPGKLQSLHLDLFR